MAMPPLLVVPTHRTVLEHGRGTSTYSPRKLAQYDGGKRVPALMMSAIADAIRWAEEILKEIDSRWPVDGKPSV